ncbi:putative DNA-binding domain-containing protein [Undibacterium sp. Ren11W]|uniref:HvfC/BufC family peptide modification chaperone n=1 Tax=Undibacterium sp. Ren11W TaxID=3413045 RepID=UPI003BF166E7
MTKHDMSDLENSQLVFAGALLDVANTQAALPLFSTELSLREGRLAFYRGNLYAIWNQALANAYPVLQQLVGLEFFEQMAHAYGFAFPSDCGDLNYFGADLSRFLRSASMTSDYPYFADVAALEWQVHRAYYAADADMLSLAGLLSAAGEDLQSATLRLHPATQLHQSATASAEVWLAHQSEQEQGLPADLNVNNFALITRKEWQVQVHALDCAAYLALQALAQGKTVEAALEVAMEQDAQFDIATQLNLWFSAGAFSAYSV